MTDDLKAFRRYYNNEMHRPLLRFEWRRRRLLLMVAASFLLLLTLSYWVLWINILALSLFMILPWFAWASWVRHEVRRFKRAFKPLVVSLILKYLDPSLRYYSGDFIPLDTFKRSRIFGISPQVYQGEDYIMGKIGSISFEMSELNLWHPSQAVGKLVQIFRGIFFHATFQVRFDGRLIIIPRTERQRFIKAFKGITRYGGQEVPDLGNDAFTAHFVAFADERVRLQEILTPSLVEAIVHYQNRAQKNLFLSFVDSHFYIAIEEPYNLLEPNVFLSNVDFELVIEFYEELQLLTSIVEEFDLAH